MAEALAEELGLSVDEVEEALEATLPSGGPGGGRPLRTARPPAVAPCR
jgi:hypothetical protein